VAESDSRVQPQRGLQVLAGFTALSLLAVWLFPKRLPLPSRQLFPGPQVLYAGVTLQPGRPESAAAVVLARSGRDLSHGAKLALWGTLADGVPIQIDELPVRVRRYDNFQLGAIKAQLGRSGASGDSSGGNFAVGGDRILITAQKSATVLESCLLSDGVGATSQGDLVKAERSKPITLQQRLQMVLGSRQPREWQCLYVAVRVPRPFTTNAAAAAIWRQLRGTALPPARRA
jgi:hypothetical protein